MHWKPDCSTYSVLACLLVRTLEWQKIFFGDWTCNKLSGENPQGTPGPFTGPEAWRMLSTLFHFWQATPRHFFYCSCPQTAHSQCNWSCLWRILYCHMANKAWFMFSFRKQTGHLHVTSVQCICSLDIFLLINIRVCKFYWWVESVWLLLHKFWSHFGISSITMQKAIFRLSSTWSYREGYTK